MTVEAITRGSTGSTPPLIDPESGVSERVLAVAQAIHDRCVVTGRPASAEIGDADLDSLAEDEARLVLRVGLISLVNDVALDDLAYLADKAKAQREAWAEREAWSHVFPSHRRRAEDPGGRRRQIHEVAFVGSSL